MNKVLIVAGACVCASLNICAQVKGQTVTDAAHSMQYTVESFTKGSVNKKVNANTDSVKFTSLDKDNGLVCLNYNQYYKVSSTDKAVVTPTKATGVAPSVEDFSANISYSDSTVGKTKTYSVTDKDMTNYNNYTFKMISMTKVDKFLWAGYKFITYADYKKQHPVANWFKSISIYVGTTLYSQEDFERYFGTRANNVCLMLWQGIFSYTPSAVLSLKVTGVEKDTYTSTALCTPTTIPANVDWTSATSLTIGESVETITEGAFASSEIETFNADANNNYSTADDGALLLDQSQEKLIAAGTGVSGKAWLLPTTVKTVVSTAMGSATGCTLLSVNDDINYNLLGGTDNYLITLGEGATLGIKNTFIDVCQDGSSYLSLSSKGHATSGDSVIAPTFIYDGNLNAYIESAAQNDNAKGLCYMDFRNCLFPDNRTFDFTLPSAINHNCLIYLPSDVKATGDNVIIGNQCANLSLIRESQSPFANIIDFKAAKATMTSTPFSQNYVIFCFPFSMPGDITLTGDNGSVTGDVKEMLRYCSYDGFADGILSYNIHTAEGIEANTPYLINCRDEVNTYSQLEVEDAEVSATMGVSLIDPKDADKWFMQGTYQSVSASDPNYLFYGMIKNVFTKAGAATIVKPFSGFMVCKDKAYNITQASVRVTEDNNLETTDVKSVDNYDNSSDVVVISSNGTLSVTASDSTFVNVVSVTGKSVFSGYVEGTKTLELPAGIYVVNGKKVIVK